MLNIHAIPAFNDNYIWLIEHSDSKQILIVDPGDANPVLSAVEQHGFIPSAILVTHHHSDHIGGISSLVEQFSIPVYGPDTYLIPMITDCVDKQKTIEINDVFSSINVLQIPGHTLDHIGFLIEDKLFCGDTLFGAGCGRLLGGTAAQLFNSLQQLKSLPASTKVYCTHEYTQQNLRFAQHVEPSNEAIQQRIIDTDICRSNDQPSLPSNIEQELKTNPFLRCEQHQVMQSVEKMTQQKMTDELSIFTSLRAWKDNF